MRETIERCEQEFCLKCGRFQWHVIMGGKKSCYACLNPHILHNIDLYTIYCTWGPNVVRTVMDAAPTVWAVNGTLFWYPAPHKLYRCSDWTWREALIHSLLVA